MKKEHIELVHGSGNVFADFGFPNAPAEQLKALLAAKIIGVLEKREMTARDAATRTGITASDFSRIRKAKLDRFTIDRLMTILSRLDQDVKVSVSIKPRSTTASQLSM